MTCLRPRSRSSNRRGAAAVAVVVLMLVLHLVILSLVLDGARDQEIMIRRIETVQAFYAAEAGVNMAVRELMVDDDEDGDGTIGSVSDDADDGNDPSFGQARVVVVVSDNAGDLLLTATGRSGVSTRELEATLDDG